jgi:small subunit ribosomal protein S16
MSVTIRLARFGKKFAPSYKIVVANTRDKRNGKFLDILGYYNPSENPVKFNIDKEKYSKWTGNGALVTDAVKKLVDGTYEYTPYKGSTKEEDIEKATEESTETPETSPQKESSKDKSEKEDQETNKEEGSATNSEQETETEDQEISNENNENSADSEKK